MARLASSSFVGDRAGCSASVVSRPWAAPTGDLRCPATGLNEILRHCLMGCSQLAADLRPFVDHHDPARLSPDHLEPALRLSPLARSGHAPI
jgi:hypothetical protein